MKREEQQVGNAGGATVMEVESSRLPDPRTLGDINHAIQEGGGFNNSVTNEPPNQPIDSVAVIPQGHVSLALKKSLTGNANTTHRLARSIAANTNANVTQNDEYYIISGPHIFVKRVEVEEVMGALTNPKWRMMLVKREGEVKHLTDSYFEIGEPLPQTVETQTDSVEYAQINTRIPKALKDDMVEMANLMGYASQTEFIAAAIQELVNQVKSQL